MQGRGPGTAVPQAVQAEARAHWESVVRTEPAEFRRLVDALAAVARLAWADCLAAAALP